MVGGSPVLRKPVCMCLAPHFKGHNRIKVLPRRDLIELDKQLSHEGRLIVIGDIHGCYAEFKELLSKCNFQENHDNLVLLGDLVSKGPHSIEVLSEAMRLNARVVRGNHDHGALVAFNNLCSRERIKSGLDWVCDMTHEQAKFISTMPFIFSLPKYGILAVHAGIVAEVPLQRQRWIDLCFMQNVVVREHSEVKKIGTKRKGRGQPWQELWKGPKHVLHGHAAKETVQFSPYATCMDTGCVYGNSLSACIFPSPSEIKRQYRVRSLNSLNAKIVTVKAHKAYSEW